MFLITFLWMLFGILGAAVLFFAFICGLIKFSIKLAVGIIMLILFFFCIIPLLAVFMLGGIMLMF